MCVMIDSVIIIIIYAFLITYIKNGHKNYVITEYKNGEMLVWVWSMTSCDITAVITVDLFQVLIVGGTVAMATRCTTATQQSN